MRVAQDKTGEALSAAGGAAADMQGKAAFAFGDADTDGQINLLDASALAAASAAKENNLLPLQEWQRALFASGC